MIDDFDILHGLLWSKPENQQSSHPSYNPDTFSYSIFSFTQLLELAL
jgi:hypothetical protein